MFFKVLEDVIFNSSLSRPHHELSLTLTPHGMTQNVFLTCMVTLSITTYLLAIIRAFVFNIYIHQNFVGEAENLWSYIETSVDECAVGETVPKREEGLTSGVPVGTTLHCVVDNWWVLKYVMSEKHFRSGCN